MNKNIPIYEVTYSDDIENLYAVSFVSNPAIKVDFVYMNENEKQILILEDVDKREIISPILIPNKLIYRRDKDTNEEYYIRYSIDTIRLMALDFVREKKYNNITINHENASDMKNPNRLKDGVELLSMWIIDSEESDIANTTYNFNLPKGTLMTHYKINNDDIWNSIKSNEFKGLSIEALSYLEIK